MMLRRLVVILIARRFNYADWNGVENRMDGININGCVYIIFMACKNRIS